MNQSPPTGRMLRRDPSKTNFPLTVWYLGNQYDTGKSFYNFIELYKNGMFVCAAKISECALFKAPGRSLNPTAIQVQQIRSKHLEEIYTRSLIHFADNPLRPAEYCKRLGMGIIDFVELPYTYLQAGHYFNNFKPRV